MAGYAQTVRKQLILLLEPLIEDCGFELIDIDFLSDRGRWVLKIYVDRVCGGVTLGECANISREISRYLDVKDPIAHEYVLEISSPGFNRPLRKVKDFEQALGMKVKVKTSIDIDNKKSHAGILFDVKEDMIFLKIGLNERRIPMYYVDKARIVPELNK